MSAGLLLDAATDFVDDLGAELDDVEHIQDCGRISELGVDRGPVAAERVHGGDLDPGAEVSAALGEPVREGLLRAARDQVKQPGAGTPVPVTGQADHPGQFLRSMRARVTVVPDELIDTQ